MTSNNAGRGRAHGGGALGRYPPEHQRAVGNKQTVLRAVRDTAADGGDEPVPVAQRSATDRIRAEPGQRQAVELLAQHLTGVASRYTQIHEVLHAAADGGEEDLRELWETEEDQRLTGARLWIEVLAGKGPLRPGLSHDDAADVMWLLMSPDSYYRLLHRRRWAAQQYQRWRAAAITQLLLAGHPEGTRNGRSGSRAATHTEPASHCSSTADDARCTPAAETATQRPNNPLTPR